MISKYCILLSFAFIFSSGVATAEEPFHQVEIRTHSAQSITLATSNDFSATRLEGSPDVQNLFVTVKPEAAEKMSRWTRRHLGSALDLVVDGTVLVSPTIRAEIKDGKVRIDQLDAKDASRLKSALPLLKQL